MTPIPKLSDLFTQVLSDIEASYGLITPTFGKNFLRVISGVQAAKLWICYKLLSYVQKNTWIDTADPESAGGTLERFGRVKLNRNPFPAVAAQYIATITGTIGSTVPSSTTFLSDPDSANPSMLFVVDNDFVLVSSPANITLRALTPGTTSKLAISDTLTATAPIIGVNKSATVLSEVISPTDEEDLEIDRQKGIDSFRLEPQGGAAADYRIWSSDATGVAKVYPYPVSGNENEVNVFVEATIADSTDGKGTPGASILAGVEAVIELDPDTTKDINDRGRRPINVIVHVLAITPLNVEIDIASFVGIDAPTQAIILAALQELTRSIRPFISGADVVADINDRLDHNNVVAAIQAAVPGSNFGAITITVNSIVETSYVFTDGFIPFLDDVTYS